MANYLYSNPEARQKWAATAYSSLSDSTTIKRVEKIRANNSMMAKEGANQNVTDSTRKNLDDFLAEVKQQKALIKTTMGTLNANLPIGWSAVERKSFCDSLLNQSWQEECNCHTQSTAALAGRTSQSTVLVRRRNLNATKQV